MRLKIAENMLASVTQAPHVTAGFEADFTAIMRHRERNKAEFAKKGAKLTYTAYLVAAAAEAMKVARRSTAAGTPTASNFTTTSTSASALRWAKRG
jgi:pyruvate/2-oxoglutarate dehydrogenase complex dihydrolipoamide acyltransferase (E2) component